MGRVLAAREESLGRDVAIKISMRSRHRLRRPVATGGAGVKLIGAPGNRAGVHSLGQLSDGRIFYVRKLVRGHTLADETARPASSESRPWRSLSGPMLWRLHTRVVVHRDLKPSNIMVGPFGEVLVMDWGVAKILASRLSTVSNQAHQRVQAARSRGRGWALGLCHRSRTAGDVDAIGPRRRWRAGACWPGYDPGRPGHEDLAGSRLGAEYPAAIPRRLRAIVTAFAHLRPIDMPTPGRRGGRRATERVRRSRRCRRQSSIEPRGWPPDIDDHPPHRRALG